MDRKTFLASQEALYCAKQQVSSMPHSRDLISGICAKLVLALLLAITSIVPLSARVLEVGSSRVLTLPSQAAAAARDGDTVLIDAGEYVDACRWTTHDLVIRGVGGYAHVRDRTTGGKAIWVIGGNNATVECIEFSGATVQDKNGAGIRQEGATLTLRHCFFHDNENGILAGDNAQSRILIEHCEFARNGYGDGYSHNMYVNHVAEFIIRYSFVHRAKVGHNIKSRALRTFILCNGITSGDGSTSREIDLPNGGLAVVAGNVIAHTNSAQNSNLLGYGMEGLSNPVRSLFVAHNTFVTSRGAGTFVQLPAGGCDTLVVKNNIFAGRADPITGGAVVRDTAANLVTRDASAPRFVDPAILDFHLLPDSPAIDGGVDAGAAWGMPLLPATEYVHPAHVRNRTLSGEADIGALEYPSSVSVFPLSATTASNVDGPWPNPARGNAHFHITDNVHGALRTDIIDRAGGKVHSTTTELLAGSIQQITLSLEGLPPGWYLCSITHGGIVAYRSLLVY